MLLHAGASYTIPNKLNLTSRQEAKGEIIDLFTLFETSQSGFVASYPMVQLIQQKPKPKGKKNKKLILFFLVYS